MFWIEYSNKSSQFICGHFMKNKKLIYFALPISLVLLSLVFEYLEDNGLIPEFNTLILYIYRYVTLFVVYLSIFGVFTFFNIYANFSLGVNVACFDGLLFEFCFCRQKWHSCKSAYSFCNIHNQIQYHYRKTLIPYILFYA